VPRERDTLDREELDRRERHRTTARLEPHLAALRDSNLPRQGLIERQRLLDMPAKPDVHPLDDEAGFAVGREVLRTCGRRFGNRG
jgi:hypothetical protein